MRCSNILVIGFAIILAGCETGHLQTDDTDTLTRKEQRDRSIGKLFGGDIKFFGEGDKDKTDTIGIAVNEYLWRASLDTVSFMPLRNVDPFGGVILTEWYTPENTPNERLKIDIFILDRQLKSSGIRVAIHKQVYHAKTKQWVDTKVDKKTNSDFEDVILTRARQLKVKAER